MKRLLSALLVIALALALPAAASAEDVYSASTTLDDASSANITNISRAAAAIDGIFVPYGETFSFNDTVGPRTKKYGFVKAKNGRGSKVTGGGVSQVATTMYLALLKCPGVTYSDIHTYGDRFTGDYVSDGELAIVTDYSSGKDFIFTNYEDDMVISMWLDDDFLHCSISVDDGESYSGHSSSGIISSASFPVNDSTALRNNITRAAAAIDGFTMEDGDVFSFNETVGPRTEKYGYSNAVNGRGVKVTGGGVAQVASVLWLAVKNMDDISIVEKSTYGDRYNQHYVASSKDAILVDYNADTDFSFRYTGEGTIRICVYIEEGELCCEILDESGDYIVDPEEDSEPDGEESSGGISW